MDAPRRTQHTTDAAQVADRIRFEAPAGQGMPLAVLLLSDAKYEARFDEMIATWYHFANRSSLVMAALDRPTETYFRARGVPTVRVFPDNFDAEQSVREAVLRAKVEVPFVFLSRGLRIAVVEMDIFCRSSPLLLDRGEAEVLTTEHADNDEPNVGFFVAYPTPRVVDAFRRMRAWATNPNRTLAYCDGAFDQKLMHYAWLGEGALSRRHPSGSFCRYFSQRNQLFDPARDASVTLARIGFSEVMHWVGEADAGGNWPATDPSASEPPVCVHLWSSFGSPEEQTRYAYSHGWFPPISKPEAEAALARLGRLGDVPVQEDDDEIVY